MLKDARSKSLLIGMALGDGYIGVRQDSKYKKSYYSYLTITHSIKQKDYLYYKAELLSGILEKPIKVYNIGNHGYPGVRFDAYNKYFRVLRRFMYRGRIKVISPGVLNYMTPEIIAIWYMDDGNLTLHRKNGTIHSREIYLNTYCSREEAERIQKYFLDKWDIKFRIAKHKNLFRLACNTFNTHKFIALVRPFIPECMSYKIDMKYSSPTKEKARFILAERFNQVGLTEAIVEEIRNLPPNVFSAKEVAERYGFDKKTSRNIANRKYWKDIAPDVDLVLRQVLRGAQRGPKNHLSILNEDRVSEIKRQLKEGVTGKFLARKFGVGPTTISAIKTGRNWSHVE